MNEQKTKIFPNGIMFKKPREGAPDFVRGSLSFKVDEAVEFLKKHDNKGWVNLDMLLSKNKEIYLALNEWKKPTNSDGSPTPTF